MLDTLKLVPFVKLNKFFGKDKHDKYHSFFEYTVSGLKSSPEFLGNFGYRMYKDNISSISIEMKSIMYDLKRLCTEQEFNTLFFQKYTTGQAVKRHRDPMSNTGCTILAYFGNWTGGQLIVDGIGVNTSPGDVIIMRCNMGLERPWHQVNAIESGVKYSFILNTIV